MIERRKSLSIEDKDHLSALVANKANVLIDFLDTTNIHCYLPILAEVDTQLIIEHALLQKKKFLYQSYIKALMN